MAEIIETPGSGGGILPSYGTPLPDAYIGSLNRLPPVNNPPNPPEPPVIPPVHPPNGPPQFQTLPTAAPPPRIEVVDDCMRSVRVFVGLFAPQNTVVDVFVNGVWRGTALSKDVFVDVPIAVCSLAVGDLIEASINGSASMLKTIVVSHVPFSWLTQNFDNARTGWNPYETQLTVKNVSSSAFGELFQMLEMDSAPLEGQIYAQPLYMHLQYFPSRGAAFNVVFIATEMNRVYAFDADLSHQGEDPNPPYLWKSILMPPGHVPVDVADLNSFDSDGNPQTYENVAPHIGITGTPVIDCGCNCGCGGGCERCSTPTMYVVSKSKRTIGTNTTFHVYLHALDVTTGEERVNSPVEISGSVGGTSGVSTSSNWVSSNDGNGNVVFLPQWQLQRPGLLLLDGIVYVAFGSQDDANEFAYHGWIMAYDAVTLEQIHIFCTTPVADPHESSYGGASIWMAGNGLASDGSAIYCTTGNGIYNANAPGGTNYGNSVLKLSKDLRTLSWFTPSYQDTLNQNDIDLGSGGVMIIPGVQTGPAQNLLVTCGKDGNVLLLNRDDLGGLAVVTGGNWPPCPAEPPTAGTDPNALGGNVNPSPVSNPNAVDSILIPPGFYTGGDPGHDPGVWGAPAFYSSPTGQLIFYCQNGRGNTIGNPNNGVNAFLGKLYSFSLTNGKLAVTGAPSTDFFTGEGGTKPVISSNHQVPGTAIVWAIRRSDPSIPNIPVPGLNNQFRLTLRAFDALNLPSNPNGILAGCLFEGDAGPWDTLYNHYKYQDSPPAFSGYPEMTHGYPNAGAALIQPTVMNGMVYVGCDNAVTVFGLG